MFMNNASFGSPGSWRDGLGFNALIHAHRPDIIDYSSLVQKNHIDNLNNAFDVAQNELGIARILDAEGVYTCLESQNIEDNVTDWNVSW